MDINAAESLDGVVKVYTCDTIGALDAELPLLIPNPDLTHPKTATPFGPRRCVLCRAMHRDGGGGRPLRRRGCGAPDRYRLRPPAGRDGSRKGGRGRRAARSPGRAQQHHRVASVSRPEIPTRRSRMPSTSRGSRFESSAARLRRWNARAIAARWEAVTGELTVWDSTQSTLSVRGGLASVLRIDENKIRVIAPNVGGGFGQKIMMCHPDEVLVPKASMELGPPAKYIEDRVENFIGSSQERVQIHTLEIAATKDGRVIGLKDDFLHDTGAFIPYGNRGRPGKRDIDCGPLSHSEFSSHLPARYIFRRCR